MHDKQSNRKSRDYRDEYGNLHETETKPLGQGGQGIVYRTTDGDLALKIGLIDGRQIKEEKETAEYIQKFRRFMSLPMPENIEIYLPLATLKDNFGNDVAGYIMPLLGKMQSFENLYIVKSDGKEFVGEIPKCFADYPKGLPEIFVIYGRTGGHRARLTVLSKAAAILARLHASGLVYGDISYNNIYFSNDLNVGFIDADNIIYDKLSGKGAYTPGYASPELFCVQFNELSPKYDFAYKNVSCAANDCHAFAVLVFKILTGKENPFFGKAYDEIQDESDSETADKQAFSGQLPWVGDPNDRSNYLNTTMNCVMNQNMEKLFDLTFTEGRLHPERRPPIFAWCKTLIEAADTSIKCPLCGQTYFFDEGQCSYCDTPLPERLEVECLNYNREVIYTFVKEVSADFKVVLPKRLFFEFKLQDFDEPYVEISRSGSFIYTKVMYGDVTIVKDDGTLTADFPFKEVRYKITNEVAVSADEGSNDDEDF